MMNLTRRGLDSVIRTSLIPALALLPLWLSAGCAADSGEDPQTETTTQNLGPNCVIQMPYGWSVGVNVCSASPLRHNQITLEPCHQVTIPSAAVVGHGQGSVTLVCDCSGDGQWVETQKTCQPADNN
jgi:hypothetical protein